mgnify:CR=1 FL=1
MKQRTRRPWPPKLRDVLLLLSASLLVASLLLRLQPPRKMTNGEPVLPRMGRERVNYEREETGPRESSWLKETFEGADRTRFRSSLRGGKRTVEVEAWGPPEELILSLYSVAATLRLGRFRLSREEGGGYRLFLEAGDE